jgi:uncharacterized protein (DUF1800 family)
MNRRGLFQSILGLNPITVSNQPTTQNVTAVADMSERTSPLTRHEATHLLRRLTFGPTPELVTLLTGKTPREAVEMLLGPDDVAPSTIPGQWIDEPNENPEGIGSAELKNQIEGLMQANYRSLVNWWLEQMRTEGSTATEKLTLFWSGHFTSEFTYDEYFMPPQLLYRQNLLIRKDRLLNFKALVEDITLDPAMLFYLGGVQNNKGKPNENYARELMELYTCGIGYYTEGDIKEAARVLTGWRANGFLYEPFPNGYFKTYFFPQSHDVEAKQFMGETIPSRTTDSNNESQVREQEVRVLIEILFDKRGTAIARFISRKLYNFFVYSNGSAADENAIQEMANTFVSNNFIIRPLIIKLLTSQHFYSQDVLGVQIKTPAEFLIGMQRSIGAPLANTISNMAQLNQELIDPPDVSGWPGYRTWISTATFPLRRNLADTYFRGLSDTVLNDFIRKFPEYTDVRVLAKDLISYFLPVQVSTQREEFYTQELLGNTLDFDYEWPTILNDPARTARGIRNMLVSMSKAPDFQLC